MVDDSPSETTNLPILPDDPGQFILYQTEDGRTRVEVRFFRETVWLSQKAMAELFQKDVRTINEHIRNIFSEGELREQEVIRKFRITASDGKQYDTLHYNLDVIISVGYRVKSHRGTQFRIWATQRLREYRRSRRSSVWSTRRPSLANRDERIAELAETAMTVTNNATRMQKPT